MNQQSSVRTEMLELAAKLDNSSHNLNAFKRRKSLAASSANKFMSHTLSTEMGQSKLKHHSAEKNISTLLAERKNTKRSQGPNTRTKKKPHITDFNNSYAQHFTKRRNTTNFTQFINKGNSSALSNHPKVDPNPQQSKSQRETTFPEQEKLIFKHKTLSDGLLQDWINHILMERCPEQKFDMSLTNAALKRFEMDKNSLISYGISEPNVSRILKSLFVYSIGFNNLLAEIGKGKVQVKKNMWKVFCVLVQYCSEGSVETVLSTIQKENNTQLQLVSTQLQKHKMIIQNNEIILNEKNEKICSENKELKYKAQLLEMDRNILKQNLQETQRAFQEQVSLRLRFEQKISDLHNLYRELQIKHYKLFSDLQLKNNELFYFKDKSTFYYNENLRIKKDLAAIEDTLAEKDRACKLALELAAKLKKELSEKGTYDAQRRIEKKISENIIRQKEIFEAQLTSKLKNVETAIECSYKSYKQLYHSYHQSLQENKRLVDKLNSQLLDISQRLVQQKDTSYSNAHYLSDIQLLKAKVEQKMQIVEQMQASLLANLDKMQQLELQLQTRVTTNEAFQRTIQQANSTISKLKHINQNLEESNHKVEVINELLSTKFKEVDDQLIIYKQSSNQWRVKYDQTLIELQKYKTKSSILEQQIPKLESSLSNSIEALQRTKKVEEQKLRRVQAELVQKTVELDKVKSYYCNIEDKFKNEQFERKNILIQYKHLLNAFEQLSEVIKEQAKKVSESQRHFQETALQLKLAKTQYDNAQKNYKAQLEEKTAKIKHYEQNITVSVKTDEINPMYLQDALSHILRLNSHIEALQESVNSIDMGKQEMMAKMQQQYIKSAEQQKHREAEMQQELKRKELELEYEKKKSKTYVEKIEYLELTIIAKEIKENEKHVQTYKEKEKRYLQVISQNNSKVNTLMDHLESIQNYNEQLVHTAQENSQKIANLTEEISNLNKENELLIKANKELVLQVQSYKEHQEDLLRQLAEKEQFINTHLQDNRKLRQSSSSKKLKRSRQKSPSANIKTRNNATVIKPIAVAVQVKQKQQVLSGRCISQQKKMFQTEGWRQDLTHKLKSSFEYYN